jgi:hypothetical protein
MSNSTFTSYFKDYIFYTLLIYKEWGRCYEKFQVFTKTYLLSIYINVDVRRKYVRDTEIHSCLLYLFKELQP